MQEHYTAAELADIHSSMVMNEAQAVTYDIRDGKLYMKSPYNPALVERINGFTPKLGKWHGKTKEWEFPLDKQDTVKDLYNEIYGENGFAEVSKVVIKLDVDKAKKAGAALGQANKSLWFMGKQLARTFGAGKAPKADKDVSVITGGFSTGGSGNLPTVEVDPGTVLVINDVPQDGITKLMIGLGADSGIEIMDAGAVAASTVGAQPMPGQLGQLIQNQITQVRSSAAPAGSGADLADRQAAQGANTPQTLAELQGVSKLRYVELEALLKGISLRASQLPKELAEEKLASIGLKFK